MTQAHSETILTAHRVLPVSAAPISGGAVHVRGGRIVRVGTEPEVLAGAGPGASVIALGDAAILPGLVNVHAHLDLTVLRGACEGADFFEWIRGLARTKAERLDREDLLASSRWGCLEAIRSGITTIADTSDGGPALTALVECGLRGVTFVEVFGPDERESDVSLAALVTTLDDLLPRATDLVGVGVSPHAPYSVSAGLYRRVAALARTRRLPVAVHAAESLAERRLLREGAGPFAEHLKSRGIPVEARGLGTIAYLESLGVLDTGPLVIHAVDLAGGDLDRLRRTRSSVAHCPKSNAKLGHGVAPLPDLLGARIPVGLGTDGVVSNNCCDLLEEARVALLLQRARLGSAPLPDGDRRIPGAREGLRLLTLGGAEALGLEGDIGTLEPGKAADICAVSLGGAHQVPVHDPEAAILWSTRADDVVLTMVGGRILYRAGRFTALDPAHLRRDLERVAAKARG